MRGQNAGQNPAPGLLVDISGLSEEDAPFEWILGLEMFADCPTPVPLAGPMKAEGLVRKMDKTVYFSGKAEGAFRLTCSLCAKEFELPVEVEAEAMFLPSEEEVKSEDSTFEEESAEAGFYSGETVDVFPPLRDQIALAEPMRPLCREDCRGLCLRCGADLNAGKCACAEVSGDPRFAELKKLLKEEEGKNAGS